MYVKDQLKKALSLNYWTVSKGLHYFIQVEPTFADNLYFPNSGALADLESEDLENHKKFNDSHNEPVKSQITHKHLDLIALWLDTDHTQKPREEFVTTQSSDDDSRLMAEYPVNYFIEWAISRDIEINWLYWAIDKGLVPNDPYFDSSKVKPIIKLLRRSYWTVTEGTSYLALGNTTLLGFEPPIEEVDKQTTVYFENRIEYEDLWFDFDHEVEPRELNPQPHAGFGQYKITYFIKWAISKKIDVPWLDWAIEEDLIVNDIRDQPLLEISEANLSPALPSEDKPIQAKKERKYQLMIAALLSSKNINWKDQEANSKIRNLIEQIGQPLSKDAIGEALKELRNDEWLNPLLTQLRSKVDLRSKAE